MGITALPTKEPDLGGNVGAGEGGQPEALRERIEQRTGFVPMSVIVKLVVAFSGYAAWRWLLSWTDFSGNRTGAGARGD